MKKLVMITTAVFLFGNGFAQTDSLKWVKEINEQVWKPFIAHFVSGNQEGFRSVHSKNITRVEIDRGVVMDHDKYFPPINNTAGKNKRDGSTTFELRFDKRISNGEKAWESGYYKGTYTAEGKPPRSWYGRFYVVLQKEDGAWKILTDADSSKEASAEKFNNAAAMEN